MFNIKRLNNIPKTTGVYIFKNYKNEVIYVGKALRLKERISSYFKKQDYFKNELLTNDVSNYEIIEVSSEVEALILEANLVKKYLPKYNINLRDDKSFLYIAITSEEFPRVLTLRKNDNSFKIKYLYGPFPSTKAVRNVLKIIRRIFPFCQALPKIRKACFYSHINLCRPCPGFIKGQDGQEYVDYKKIYLNNIRNIRKILSGKISLVIKDLTLLMKEFSSQRDFEKAQIIHEQIQQLLYITKPYYKIANFLEDTNFLKKEHMSSIEELLQILKEYFPKLAKLTNIEGIDISNILGDFATGSLVVFENGQKKISAYKQFKIHLKGANDTGMIQEILERRLKHVDWTYPDLFIIDGGKNQVSAANQIISGFTNIPVIGLAKREETIIIPVIKGFKSLRLKRNQLSLRLIQEIRDESHRFARKYHHLLRKKLIS